MFEIILFQCIAVVFFGILASVLRICNCNTELVSQLFFAYFMLFQKDSLNSRQQRYEFTPESKLDQIVSFCSAVKSVKSKRLSPLSLAEPPVFFFRWTSFHSTWPLLQVLLLRTTHTSKDPSGDVNIFHRNNRWR